MRNALAIVTALCLSNFLVACSSKTTRQPDNRKPNTTDQVPGTQGWTLKLQSKCPEGAGEGDCVAAYGFSIYTDGHYLVGPGPQGETRTGTLAPEELATVMRKSRYRYIVLCSCLVFLACSSGAKKGEHFVKRIFLYNVHVRRPARVGAVLTAIPRDFEYESHPRPNERLDCESFKELFQDVDLSALRDCLLNSSKMQTQRIASYALRRDTAPFLVLEENEKSPICNGGLPKKIPVPREIFFQSNDEGNLGCYSARIPIVSEEFLGIKAALYSVRVNITFPLEKVPTTDEETLLLLGSWVIQPFFDENKGIISKVVSTEICKKCIGEKLLFQVGSVLPPLWP